MNRLYRLPSAETFAIEWGPLIAATGLLICALVLGQVGWWCAVQLEAVRNSSQRLESRRRQMRMDIDRCSSTSPPLRDSQPAWRGYRKFVVDRIVQEAESIVSVYLKPEDERPLPGFLPGQHLTFAWNLPGQSSPVIRCYSLSDRPRREFYRITVKVNQPSSDQTQVPVGRVSSFINQQLQPGEVIDVRAPAGSFFVEPKSMEPVILLAAGIGVTPLLSMLNTIAETNPRRLVLLVYTVRNSTQHAFKHHLRKLEQQFRNVQVVTSYTQPLPSDELGTDYNYAGHPDVGLLKQLLPNPNLNFYVCGPPAFMKSIYRGLLDWGAPEDRIHFEAFGPASIQKVTDSIRSEAGVEPAESTCFQVEFCASRQKLEWSGEFDNLLDFAEAHGIPLESGCRAGNCRSCELELVVGKVGHPEHVGPTPGTCLACVAVPQSHLKLEA